MEVGQGPNWGCSAKEKKYILVVCAPMCNLSLLFQKEEYEAYRASLLEMAAEVRKTIIKLRKLKK
jgi:hypothetical protein